MLIQRAEYEFTIWVRTPIIVSRSDPVLLRTAGLATTIAFATKLSSRRSLSVLLLVLGVHVKSPRIAFLIPRLSEKYTQPLMEQLIVYAIVTQKP